MRQRALAWFSSRWKVKRQEGEGARLVHGVQQQPDLGAVAQRRQRHAVQRRVHLVRAAAAAAHHQPFPVRLLPPFCISRFAITSSHPIRMEVS